MRSYRDVLGKVEGLQCGFTSGTCAQAASKAAALMLTGQQKCSEVTITLKGGMELTLPVINQYYDSEKASCSIIKDSGDDSDITHEKEFCSEVSWSDNPGITIAGGQAQAKGKIFRIAHLGYTQKSDVMVALSSVEMVLKDLGYKFEYGASVSAAIKSLKEK